MTIVHMFVNKRDASYHIDDAKRCIQYVKDVYSDGEITEKSRDKSIAKYEYIIKSADAYLNYLYALEEIDMRYLDEDEEIARDYLEDGGATES